MQDSRAYGQTSNTVFKEAETKVAEESDKKTLIVIASSDKGLCGGIHSGLGKHTRRMLATNPNADLVVIGEKAKAQMSRSNSSNIKINFTGIGKAIPTFADASLIADQIASLPEKYDSIQIVYNKFINAQSYEATVIDAYSVETIVNSANFAAFEIDDAELPNLQEYALTNSLYWALAEGHACEQSARRNAMDVRNLGTAIPPTTSRLQANSLIERFQERWRHDHQVPDSLQPHPSSRHYQRAG